MNYTLIILGILLLVIIYILIQVLSERGKSVANKVDLSATNGSVSYKALKNPKASRFSLSLWVYLENLKSTGNTDIIYIKKNDGSDFLKLSVTDTTILKYNMALQNGEVVTNEIMGNFPLQKWVYVIISVDNKIIDLYVDGKLVRSQQLDSPPVSTDSDFNISYGSCNGGNKCKGHVAKFERIPQPMDPSTAWTKYMQGNGGSYFSKMLSSYGATVTLTKDDLDLRQFTLF
jgi:hypothetical protein